MPKLLFKGEDFDEGVVDEIGPVFVLDDDGKPLEDRGWMSRKDAKALAAELGYELELDAMTDEELARFKVQQGYA